VLNEFDGLYYTLPCTLEKFSTLVVSFLTALCALGFLAYKYFVIVLVQSVKIRAIRGFRTTLRLAPSCKSRHSRLQTTRRFALRVISAIRGKTIPAPSNSPKGGEKVSFKIR